MKVRAMMPAYYRGRRIRPGEVFDLHKDDKFSTNWMQEVDPVAEPLKAKPAQKKAAAKVEPEHEAQSVSDADVI